MADIWLVNLKTWMDKKSWNEEKCGDEWDSKEKLGKNRKFS